MNKLVVLSIVLGLTAAKPSGLGWAGLTAWGGAHWGLPVAPVAAPLIAAAPVAHAGPAIAVTAPLHGAVYNYRGPLSLAPGQPANIVAHDGRPLDTLSVNVDRALHYTAKAVDHANGIHVLGKRSAPSLAPAAWSHTARIDVPFAHGFGFGHAAAIRVPAVHAAWRTPIAVGHLGAWPHAAAWGPHW